MKQINLKWRRLIRRRIVLKIIISVNFGPFSLFWFTLVHSNHFSLFDPLWSIWFIAIYYDPFSPIRSNLVLFGLIGPQIDSFVSCHFNFGLKNSFPLILGLKSMKFYFISEKLDSFGLIYIYIYIHIYHYAFFFFQSKIHYMFHYKKKFKKRNYF